MKVPSSVRKMARELFGASVVDGRLEPDRVRRIAGAVVAGRGRRSYQVLREYRRLVRLELAKRHAVVESATGLPGEVLEALRGGLRGRYGDDLTAEFRVDPGLIGGVRVQVGADVWDASLRGRLARLDDELGRD